MALHVAIIEDSLTHEIHLEVWEHEDERGQAACGRYPSDPRPGGSFYKTPEKTEWESNQMCMDCFPQADQ
jgi:hypothetical protein